MKKNKIFWIIVCMFALALLSKYVDSIFSNIIDAKTRNEGLDSEKHIIVVNNVWFFGKVVFITNVTIDDNFVIDSESLVTIDILSNSPTVGNPCKVIRIIE